MTTTIRSLYSRAESTARDFARAVLPRIGLALARDLDFERHCRRLDGETMRNLGIDPGYVVLTPARRPLTAQEIAVQDEADAQIGSV